MVTRDDIQSWLDRLDGGGLQVNEPEAGLWIVRTADGTEVVLNHAPPVIILRVRVLTVPGDPAKQAALFRLLLTLNVRDLVHGSYGLEGEQVVLTDTLELEELDYSEFEASFDSMTLALASHMTALTPYRDR